MIALPANAGNFISSLQVKRPNTHCTCVPCKLPITYPNYLRSMYFYPASTSHRTHAITLKKARKLQVTSHAGCRLTYLQLAGESTRGVIADFLQLQVNLCGIAGILACDCAGIFSCVCSYFCLQIACIFACRSRQFCMLVAGKLA